jgi:hypothetical protein
MDYLAKYKTLKVAKPNHVSAAMDRLKEMGFNLTRWQIMACVKKVGSDRLLQEAHLVHSNFKDYRSQMENQSAVLYRRIIPKHKKTNV